MSKITCPHCNDQITLKKWWSMCRKRIDIVTQYQTHLVANNIGKGLKVNQYTHKKYAQSEKLLKKLGFYDQFSFPPKLK